MENNPATQSVIDAQVEITGTLKTSGSIKIDGKLKGDLNCDGDATIGKSAVINGNLTVKSVSVAGSVNGNISAKDRIQMQASARVMGDIKAKRLHVEDGVTFVGKSEVNPSGSSAAPQTQPEGEKADEESKGNVFGGKK